MDRNWSQVLWTVGRGKSNDFQTKTQEIVFRFQHHATMIDSHSVLLFDNGLNHSRIIKLKLNQVSHSADLIEEFIPNPKLFSRITGAAFLLKNGNALGFFPGDDDSNRFPIVEFDSGSHQEVGRLFLFENSFRAVNRPVLANSLGMETPYEMGKSSG